MGSVHQDVAAKQDRGKRQKLFCLLRLIGSRPILKGTGFRTPLEYGVLILKVILKCLLFQLKEFKVNVWQFNTKLNLIMEEKRLLSPFHWLEDLCYEFSTCLKCSCDKKKNSFLFFFRFSKCVCLTSNWQNFEFSQDLKVSNSGPLHRKIPLKMNRCLF